MKLSELIKLSKEVAELNINNLNEKALTLASNKARWIELYSLELLQYKKIVMEYEQLKVERWKYYTFDYDYTLDKKVIMDIFLPGDKELSKKQLEIDLSKEKLNFIEKIQQTLTGLGFTIKNIIDWEKFQAGE